MMLPPQILLGDCRDLMRTLAPNSVDAVITDPPYGVNYQPDPKFKRIANDERPYVWWLPDAYRVLKDGGALLCFCPWRTSEPFRLAIEWAGFKIRSQIVWDREWHGQGDLTASFGPRHDLIWFATKGKFAFPNKRPVSVIRSKRISAGALVHPTEKPIDLMQQLVEAVTPTGGVVLDPFAGSGATLHAAREAGRHSIGIELDPDYVTLIEKRLALQDKRAA